MPEPGLVDEHPALGEPVGDRHRVVAEARREHLAHRSAGDAAGREQRRRDRAQQRAQRVEQGEGQHGDGQRERQQHDAEPGIERPRAQVLDRAEPGDAVDRQPQHFGKQRDRDQGHRDEHDDQRRPDGQRGHHPPQRAVRQRGQRALPRAAGQAQGGRQRGDLGAQEAVGDTPVDAQQRPAGARSGEQDRQPDAEQAEGGAGDEQQHGQHGAQRDRDAHEQVAERLGGAGRAPVELQRGDHDRPSTSTSPVLERTSIENGASETWLTPRTVSEPEALAASTW